MIATESSAGREAAECRGPYRFRLRRRGFCRNHERVQLHTVLLLPIARKMTGALRSTVRAVESRRDLRRFIDYPYRRHAADPHWIPPLRLSEAERLSPKHNPFFAHADVALLLAWRDGVVAGRIAAIDDRLHLEAHGDNVAMFGFFEAADAEA